MLYYDFKNYEEFKEIFGLVEHGNGVVSRKNKILLALYKSKFALRAHIRYRAYASDVNMYNKSCGRYERIRFNENATKRNMHRWETIKRRYYCYMGRYDGFERSCYFLTFRTLAELKGYLYNILEEFNMSKSSTFELILNKRRFLSPKFETDKMLGICEDGTVNAIRYINTENGKVFKMKAGKMFNHIMENNALFDYMPEQIKRWLSEEWVGEWNEYANRVINPEDSTLHVDDDFRAIYSSYRYANGDFHSCMVDDGQWKFYRDSVKAKAAYTTDKDGRILARCILFTEVREDGSDKIWRLAERQYSVDSNLGLQRQLVRKLIDGGYIDGYKSVGASCHDANDFVDNDGKNLSEKKFSIVCNLSRGDTLSYQDSFKWYDEGNNVAYNYGNTDSNLDTTSSTFEVDDDDEDEHEGEVYSEYHDCYISDDDAYYVNSREDYFYSGEVVYANVWNGSRFYEEYCFENDCLYIGDEYYYAGHCAESPEDYNIAKCPSCNEFFIKSDGYYSDYTEEYYCCGECLDDAETYAHEKNGEVYVEYDGGWFDSDDVISAREWSKWYNKYEETTIYIETFNDLVENGEATIYDGDYYIDYVNFDGEPAHLVVDCCSAVA
ncbi:hypothetical protein [Prevotella sp. E2-28]|uniref:hypothetical protein n=1 Tax=Prevotella sp. E2-28 TaxID=2913620 RepID=UPI001ED9EB7F|nr:hypothetical protein [Prevotella sp. E2-28]UKK52695.1 hypothetical protein L6465_08765 [Prevotella sp. E2-28]